MDRQRRHLLQAALAGALGVALPGLTTARPDLTRTMGTTLADRGSAFYRFQDLRLSSMDRQRHYRVWIAEPKHPAPAGGHPALFMLDGNAVISRLRETWLGQIQDGTPPVLVMIGYDTDLLFNGAARQYDYTPAAPGEHEIHDPRRADRRGGGAARFLEWIDTTLTPRVATLAPINPARASLWGHSYGGLFTLFALCTRPAAFHQYFPTSPSLWWAGGLINLYLKALAAHAPTPPAEVWLCRGNEEGRRTDDLDEQQWAAAKRRANRDFNRFAGRLDQVPALRVRHRLYDGQGHGGMFSASLPETLRLAAGLPPALDWH
ncbi:alpha/beta hydrolase [Alloalcanivorax mobilis]|uniref:alpha/beta hydrolase n=1 Tax=Alloalcanivorax mobilis TaxID=2019569 RepID=UPI000C78586F|nr:alpha/beta hydrolase-fold protein [Alloalcanivorax mobilis]